MIDKATEGRKGRAFGRFLDPRKVYGMPLKVFSPLPRTVNLIHFWGYCGQPGCNSTICARSQLLRGTWRKLLEARKQLAIVHRFERILSTIKCGSSCSEKMMSASTVQSDSC
jgi:hypothetical protein